MSLITRVGVRVGGVLKGRRPGLNFVGGSNMTITGADNPSNGRVDLTFDAAGGGGAAGNDPTVLTVNKAGGLVVGDTTVPVLGTLPTGFNSKDIALCFDPWTTNAEYVGVSSLSGQSFTLARALRLPHANASTVLVNPAAGPELYGAKGDINVTDDHRAIQRMYLECSSFGDKPNNYHLVRQPIYCHNGEGGILLWVDSSFDSQCVQGNVPVHDFGRPNSAVVHPARAFASFTATSGQNYLTYASDLESLGSSVTAVGKAIAFNAPYGETLPGGIVSGRIYTIVSYDSTLRRIQIAENATPSTAITFSASGAGWCYSNMENLQKLFWSGLRVALGRAGTLDGIHVLTEQQSDIDNVRCDHQGTLDAADSVGVHISGQFGHITNLESNPNGPSFGDKTAVAISGTGFYTDFLTMNGPGQGLRISGQHHTIGFLLCETLVPGVYIAPGARGILIASAYYSTFDVNQPMIKIDVSGAAASWEIGPVVVVTTGQAIIGDNLGNIYFRSGDGSRWSGVGDTDEQGVFPGVIARAGAGAYELKGRYHMGTYSAGNGPFKLRRLYKGVNVNTSGGSDEVWLSAAPWDDLDHVVGKVSSSANTLTVKDSAGTVLDTIGAGVKKVIHYRRQSGVWVKESEVTL